MRVHPDFRRQKIGTKLDSAARQLARENGCRVARLVTSMKNIPAQATLDTEGYSRVAQFNEWETEPAPEDFSMLRVASDNDVHEILGRWRESEIYQASRAVVANRRWHWKEIDDARLRKHIAANEVRVAPGGFAIVCPLEEKDWNGLTIYALAGDKESMVAIARAVRGEAHYRGYSHVEASVAECAPLNASLQRAGYRTDGGLFLYEQGL
jgi:GNAT superfamily N-acetyltransferase